ncbi:hypothetical protein [Microbacterium sp. 10M-3C3]|jgi:Sec-independent protein secretion pathway component TatC|uniref:hypothetical protein n=1 Tax=Microbacterium sp. 10M-3C3 TaxID=2483401 RepID=UPI000F62DC16|nr:hypothetical protein [Microbacterium sp. 10M-3C3]
MTEAAASARRRQMPLGVVMVGMAAVVWWPAFTLGAWNEVFFDDVLAVWAASTAACAFVLIEHRPWPGRIRRALFLLLPSLWLVLNFVVGEDSADLATALLTLAGLVAVVVGFPFTVWVLVRIVWPDLGDDTPRRTKAAVVAVVVGIAVVSFVLGLNQARFLTCEDFTISGNSEPPGCTPAPPA